jgi:peptidoglycan/LPS O-acetylase OafA/YrhL
LEMRASGYRRQRAARSFGGLVRTGALGHWRHDRASLSPLEQANRNVIADEAGSANDQQGASRVVGTMGAWLAIPCDNRVSSRCGGRRGASNFRSMHVEGTCDVRHATGAALLASRRPELLALTSVRAFAALEVVLQHTLFELGGEGVRPIPAAMVDLLIRGGLAVSFFFVLSGFILAYTYCDGENELKTTPSKFWRARFARIYPLYFLGFLMDGPRVIALFVSSVASLPVAVAKSGVAALAYLTLLQSWHPRVTNTWNTPGWTLSVEAFFYAAFPILLRVTKSWRLRWFCLIALATWALPMLAYAILFEGQMSVGAHTFWRSFPLLRLPEFVLGVAAGRLFLSKHLEPYRKGLGSIGALALGLVLALALATRFLPGAVFESSLGAPLFAVAIVALASGAIPTPSWLNGPVLVLLGRASYAVYILHQPFKHLFLTLAHLAHFEAPTAGLLLAYLLSLQLFCIGLFLWFEDPMRRLITKSRSL